MIFRGVGTELIAEISLLELESFQFLSDLNKHARHRTA